MEVRSANRHDLLEIGRLAHEAWWEAYSGLVSDVTINRALAANYTPAVLAERLLKNFCFVALTDDAAAGFAEGMPETDRVVLHTIYCLPKYRHQGIASDLLGAVRNLAPGMPICSDVVLGNLVAESFHESWGFSPGEVFEGDIEGEPVVQRRWWLPAEVNLGHGRAS